MPKLGLGKSVLAKTMERLDHLYSGKYRPIVSFSGGKDSGVCVELAIMAAAKRKRLPIEVALIDEEIVLPGTYEYAQRIAARPEVRMHWIVNNQQNVNLFNRDNPYWYTFDPLYPDKWVRQPPPGFLHIPDPDIYNTVNVERFPVPADDWQMVSIIGIRADESWGRKMAVSSMKNNDHAWLTQDWGNRAAAFPIYDWTDGDVWLAFKEFGWEYAPAYNDMYRNGFTKKRCRMGPISHNGAAVEALGFISRTWPNWFDKVCHRLPGIRTGAKFGKDSILPVRRLGETWEKCFQRTCIDETTDWIRERSILLRDKMLAKHNKHSTAAFPEVANCLICQRLGSWKALAEVMYTGGINKDQSTLEVTNPRRFRPDRGWDDGKDYSANWAALGLSPGTVKDLIKLRDQPINVRIEM